MYEAPPCESQAWKVAPARRQENTDGTYLDHATARRCSEPFALLPAKFLSKLSLVPGTDAGNGEEMPQGLACGKGQDRTRAKLPPAPGPRPLSMPAGPAAPRDPGPTSSDDKEGPPEEEIYLVCEPPSPPHCRTTCAPRPPLGQVPPPRLPKLSKAWLIPPPKPRAKPQPGPGAVAPRWRILACRTRPGTQGTVTGMWQRACCRGSIRTARSWCARARGRAGTSHSPWPCCTRATSTTSPSATWRAAASTRWARTGRAARSGSTAWPASSSTTASTPWC
ncbi:SH2 domain-containing protein 6 isoform X5 [Mauremys mutica]|uniref:SH2 domain-containing protein 6 isoform X5 n=1 Tax=Mauremys mutica TaxID=74926 RepID=UPI001D16ACCA|nr:SH2 domain-containing protein 6 isoform X5 [Mauremys mutica]